MTYNTEGIILKYRDIGEYDRIYSILTRDHGKVEGWAQGVRKPQSKLVAHLQPLYLCDFMIARGRRFDRIAQVRVLNRWASVWSDLVRLGEAMYAASLVDLVSRPGAKEKGVFELMESTLNVISTERSEGEISTARHTMVQRSLADARDDKTGNVILTIFSLKLLKESGFAPELRNCVLCKAAVDGLTRHFDAIRGGVLCSDCFRKAGSEAFPISSLTIETLEEVLGAPLAALEMPEAVRRELSTISDAMIRAHFGETPKARMFVEGIAKELPQMSMV